MLKFPRRKVGVSPNENDTFPEGTHWGRFSVSSKKKSLKKVAEIFGGFRYFFVPLQGNITAGFGDPM